MPDMQEAVVGAVPLIGSVFIEACLRIKQDLGILRVLVHYGNLFFHCLSSFFTIYTAFASRAHGAMFVHRNSYCNQGQKGPLVKKHKQQCSG
jgi:hypothetical protein